MKFAPRYFLASTALLLVLVALYAGWSTRRTREDLLRQLESHGVALAETLETSHRAAIQANALMEEMVAERLLDNARLIDRLLEFPRLDPAALQEVAGTNHLRRIDLLDDDGRPWTPPPPPPPGPGRGMAMMRLLRERGMEMPHDREARRAMMMYLWGRRWSRPREEAAPAPPAVQDRKFWEGTVFGVAVGARSFPGIIAVHADAEYVLNFRKEMGVERQVEELGRQSGIAFVALLDRELNVVARSAAGPPAAGDGGRAERGALAEGRTVTRLIRDGGGHEVFEVIRPIALAGGAPALLRIGLSTASIDTVWRRDLSASLLLGLGVLVVGTLGLAMIFYTQHRHLREVRALEAAMAQGERLASLGNMAATVAHEIRNPLNAVSMGLQRLGAEFKPEDAAEYDRLVGLMHGEVRRLNGIVEEFLSIARPVALTLSEVQAADVLRELVTLIEAEANAANVRAVVQAPPGLPAVRADGDRLRQVLLNLARNALEAMPEGGTLTLAAAPAGDGVVMEVCDTGAGIPADLLPRIFEPYVTTKAAGLGLGLAIARRIAEAHGGRIDAESRPGRTCFRMWLPRRGPQHG